MKKRIKHLIKSLTHSTVIEYIIEKKRYIINKKLNTPKLQIFSKNSQLKTISNKNFHTFFGYYDISPFNEYTNEILYLRVSKKQLKNAEVILHNLKTDQFKIIASSDAWNWQQGSRLRWFPNSPDEIVFNDFQNGRYFSRKINIRNNQELIIDYPIYDIDNRGKYAITLNFERLGIMRPGYGYTNMKYKPKDNLVEEAISILDIHQNKKIETIYYKQIAIALNISISTFSNNYINHLSFSPEGDKFLFFWLTIENTYHKAFLMVYDLMTKKLTPLETEEKVSHYVWLNENCILCTSYNADQKCRYFKYWLNGKKEIVNPDSLTNDGHPSIIADNFIITDTYPDKNGYQKIIKSDICNDRSETIAKIYSCYKIEQEKRTDLHPRLNKKKDKICFDANLNGYRQLFIIDNFS